MIVSRVCGEFAKVKFDLGFLNRKGRRKGKRNQQHAQRLTDIKK